MVRIRTKTKGLDQVQRELKQLAKKYPSASAAAVYQEGLALIAESQRRIPVDTGRGRSTAYVSPPKVTSNVPTVEVGYGADYLVYVHERTELNHPTGEAKFLQNAANERKQGYDRRLARRIRDNVQQGVAMQGTDFPEKPKVGGAGQVRRSR